ncbi:MAG: glycosyltransferase [Nostoc sp. LLA-1]|nr:glycosyltransferase [Cyanocohniella sp. LLY]
MTTNMNPEVSVIIPAYNTAAYISQTIESALGQTLKNIEVIVVDDASTDETPEVARSFTDERLKVFVNPQNLGVAATRNRALKEAKGRWIAVLDSDDWYAPERLEKLLQLPHTQNADIIADDLFLIRDGEDAPWSTLINESGEVIEEIKQIDPQYFVETDVYGQQGLHLGLSKPLFRRDFMLKHDIKYDASMKVSEDFWLALKCLVRGARFFLLPQSYYYYRSRPGSLVYSSKIKRLEQDCQATVAFIEQEDCLRQKPEVAHALSKNLTVFKKNLAYYRVVDSLKQRQWFKGFIEMVRNPYFFWHFSIQLPGIINRRIQRYLFGNTAAYDMFYRSKDQKILKI